MIPAIEVPTPHWAIRLVVVIGGLIGWYATQHLIGCKPKLPSDQVETASSLLTDQDRLLRLTAGINRFLNTHPKWADSLLVVSSLVIDLLGLFLILWSVLGPSIGPFLGLIILFGLRQVCQAVTTLPPPIGMLWRSPGFPSLFVTYRVSNDLFFSGHTALAVYGAVQLAHLGPGVLILLCVTIIIFQITTVLVLRVHYTMDVFTGLVTALYVAALTHVLAPGCDLALCRLFSS